MAPMVGRLTMGKRKIMPDKFHVLAVYNSERNRGIMHTPAWDARMAELQRGFDQWARVA